MATRIYSDTALSATQLHHLLENVHRTIVQHGRDYVYQERITHRVSEPSAFLFGRVLGYQDTYVPYSRQNGARLLVGCTCSRALPCAHVVALWWSYLQNPGAFMRVPYALGNIREISLPEIAAGSFSWDHIPAEKPFWQNPWNLHDMPQWLLLVERAGETTAWEETSLSQVLFDLDPTWTDSTDWLASWSSFLVRHWGVLTRQPLTHWWKLLLHNPAIPLAPLWPGYTPVPGEQWLSLLARTLTHTGPAVKANALSHLVDLTPASMLKILSDVVREIPSLDPWHMVNARLLDRRGLRPQAIKVLEGTSPESPVGRHAIRQQLMEWLPESEGLAYRITDCLESDDWDCLQALKPPLLDHDGYEALEAAKRSRMASRVVVSDAKSQ